MIAKAIEGEYGTFGWFFNNCLTQTSLFSNCNKCYERFITKNHSISNTFSTSLLWLRLGMHSCFSLLRSPRVRYQEPLGLYFYCELFTSPSLFAISSPPFEAIPCRGLSRHRSRNGETFFDKQSLARSYSPSNAMQHAGILFRFFFFFLLCIFAYACRMCCTWSLKRLRLWPHIEIVGIVVPFEGHGWLAGFPRVASFFLHIRRILLQATVKRAVELEVLIKFYFSLCLHIRCHAIEHPIGTVLAGNDYSSLKSWANGFNLSSVLSKIFWWKQDLGWMKLDV